MIKQLIEKISLFSQELARQAEEDRHFVAGQQDALQRVLGEINAMQASQPAQGSMAEVVQAAMQEAQQPTEDKSGRKNRKSAGRKKTAGTK